MWPSSAACKRLHVWLTVASWFAAAAYTSLESAKVVTSAAGRLLLGGPRQRTAPDAKVQLEALPWQHALEGGSAADARAAQEDEAPSEVHSSCDLMEWCRTP